VVERDAAQKPHGLAYVATLVRGGAVERPFLEQRRDDVERRGPVPIHRVERALEHGGSAASSSARLRPKQLLGLGTHAHVRHESKLRLGGEELAEIGRGREGSAYALGPREAPLACDALGVDGEGPAEFVITHRDQAGFQR
jgi:hypothetical protein